MAAARPGSYRTPVLLALLLTTAAVAQEAELDAVLDGFDALPAAEAGAPAGGMDEVLQGFDEPAPSVQAGGDGGERRGWDLGGSVTAAAAYNLGRDAPLAGAPDYRGLSRLRLKLNLEADADLAAGWQAHATGYAFHDAFYALRGRDQFPDATLDAMEDDAELGEAWLRGRLAPQVDIKLGRQIVVWGKSDNLRVTDVLNPLDNREPGLTDIEDLRLPLSMARLDYYTGPWGLSAIAIGEVRFNKNPPFGADFYPLPTPQPPEAVPSDFGGNTEYALAANGIFSGWDLSLYWAQLFDDQAYLAMAPTPRRHHARVTMTGAATNVARGNWLLKAELAHFDGLRASGVAGGQRRTDLLLGVEYSGLPDQTLSLELVDRHLHDFADALEAAGADEDALQTALRYQGDFRHNRLHATLLSVMNGAGGSGGGFSRASLAYDLRDALTVTGGLLLFHAGDLTPFDRIADRGRGFAELKYSF